MKESVLLVVFSQCSALSPYECAAYKDCKGSRISRGVCVHLCLVFVCLYLYICKCVYVYVYLCMSVCLYCVSDYLFVYLSTYKCVYVFVYIYKHNICFSSPVYKNNNEMKH